jgi:hypothetical protein
VSKDAVDQDQLGDERDHAKASGATGTSGNVTPKHPGEQGRPIEATERELGVGRRHR